MGRSCVVAMENCDLSSERLHPHRLYSCLFKTLLQGIDPPPTKKKNQVAAIMMMATAPPTSEPDAGFSPLKRCDHKPDRIFVCPSPLLPKDKAIGAYCLLSRLTTLFLRMSLGNFENWGCCLFCREAQCAVMQVPCASWLTSRCADQVYRALMTSCIQVYPKVVAIACGLLRMQMAVFLGQRCF